MRMRLARPNFAVSLGVIFVAALALRVGVTMKFVGLSSPPDFDANPDQIDYEMFAHRMSTGLGYTVQTGEPTARRAPGTSLMLLPIYKLFGHSYAAGRLWFCLLSALTCVIVGWLGKQYFGPATGLVAAAWLGVYPGHFYYTMHFISETPYSFWLAGALALTVLAIRRPSVAGHVAAGVCWGMAALTRPPILIAVPIALLLVWFSRNETRRTYLKPWAIQACVFLAVMSPWVARNALVLGKPAITTHNGVTFWGSNNELVLRDPALRGGWVKHSRLSRELRPLPGGEIARDAAAKRYGLEFVRSHWAQMPGLILAKLYRLVWPIPETPNVAVRWAFALGWIAVMPFLAVGMVQGVRRSAGLSMVLVLPMTAIFATAVIYYGSDRFRDSCAPAFLVFASLGLVQTVGWVARRWVAHNTPHHETPTPVTKDKQLVSTMIS